MKTVFNIVFKDANYQDWKFTLHTSNPKTDNDIKSLIEYWSEVCDRNIPDYSPVDIMDYLVDDQIYNEGNDWYWTDMDYNVMEIEDW